MKKINKRFTQHKGLRLFLEKIIKFSPISYKLAYLIKRKFFGSLFVEDDFKGIDKINLEVDSTCIDIGGNTGQSIEYFKSRFKEVHSFEPNEENYEFLKKKYKSYKNLKIYNFALGNKNVIKTLYIPYWKNIICLHQSASLIKQECYKSLGEFLSIKRSDIFIRKSFVKVKKLNDFNFKNISLVKIDAEGYEVEVLKGMTKYLSKDIHILLENSSASFEASKKLLKKYNYEGYRFYNNSFTKEDLDKALNVYFFHKKNKKNIFDQFI